MSLITRRICDRCGEEFSDQRVEWCRIKGINYHWYNPETNEIQGSNQEQSLDLCVKCPRKLRFFLSQGGEEI